MNPYPIPDDLLRLVEILELAEGDLSRLGIAEAEFTAWLDGIAAREAEAADEFVAMVKSLELKAAVVRAEADHFKAEYDAARSRVDSIYSRIDWLKEGWMRRMSVTGCSKLATPKGRTVWVQRNASAPLRVAEHLDLDAVPPDLVRVRRELDRDKLRQRLEAGEVFEFAELGEAGTHLRIR